MGLLSSPSPSTPMMLKMLTMLTWTVKKLKLKPIPPWIPSALGSPPDRSQLLSLPSFQVVTVYACSTELTDGSSSLESRRSSLATPSLDVTSQTELKFFNGPRSRTQIPQETWRDSTAPSSSTRANRPPPWEPMLRPRPVPTLTTPPGMPSSEPTGASRSKVPRITQSALDSPPPHGRSSPSTLTRTTPSPTMSPPAWALLPALPADSSAPLTLTWK